MALDFTYETFIDAAKLTNGEKTKPTGIPSSNNLTGIELRLSKAFIINNKTPRIFPFPGYAKIYVIIIVVSDTGDVLQNLDLKSFAKVDDQEDIPIDKTIYYWKQNKKTDKAPSQIHSLVSVIKSKEDLRDVGNVLTDVRNDAKFSETIQKLKAVVNTTSQFNDVSNILFEVGSLVGKFLGRVDDKTLLTWVQSYSDINGDWDQLGKSIKNRKNRYAEIDLSLTIRDVSREKLLADAQSITTESEDQLTQSGQ